MSTFESLGLEPELLRAVVARAEERARDREVDPHVRQDRAAAREQRAAQPVERVGLVAEEAERYRDRTPTELVEWLRTARREMLAAMLAAGATIAFARSVVLGAGADVGIDWHGHNDRGLALENALWALEFGADRVHGTALGIGGQLDQALPDFDKAIELDPTEAVAYNNRGAAYAKLGNFAAASADLLKALNDANDTMVCFPKAKLEDK